MTNEQFKSPFNLHLQCFNHLNEINSLITSLAENDSPTMNELESIANAIYCLLIKTDCYISMQEHNLRIMNSAQALKGGERHAH